MAKLALTPAQEEQLANMVKDKKDNGEIKAFFKDNYQVDLPGWKMAYAREKAFGKTASSGNKRQYHKKSKEVTTSSNVPGGNIVQEIVKLLSDIHSGYDKIFKHLRLELIKSRAQVYDMIKGAGIKEDEE